MRRIDLSEAEARALLQRALARSTADHCEVSLRASSRGNIRTARNAVSTSGVNEDHVVTVRASFGRRSASASANQLDDATLARTVKRAEELARLAPEDPEWVAPLGPQAYAAIPAAWSGTTASLTPAARAELTAAGLAAARERDCVAASFLQDARTVTATLTATGLFGFHRATSAEYSITSRTADDLGSGYAERDANDVARIDAGAAGRIATEKALASRSPRTLEPGRYPVILEPTAAVELVDLLVSALNARAADEGRSPFSRPEGGSRIGEQLLSEAVTIRSDPAHPDIPGAPWAGDGRPQQARTWIERGVLRALHGSRYWAQKTGAELPPPPGRYIVDGGGGSLEDLIRGAERAVLVTRFWYIRGVDPRTLLYTGLTRDGTFLVENGRIAHAIKNFRFNESPLAMLRGVEALSAPVRAQGALVPAMRLRDFGFTSLSDAV